MTERDMAGEATAGVVRLGRLIVLAGLAAWTWHFASAPVGVAAMDSVLHIPNLVVHEAC